MTGLMCAAEAAIARDAAYQPPRLTDGRADMQGVWAHFSLTPLERPESVAGHYITQEEAAGMEARLADVFDAGGEPTEFYDARRIETIGGRLRSSLIVDPLDGRVPGNEYYVRESAMVLRNFRRVRRTGAAAARGAMPDRSGRTADHDVSGEQSAPDHSDLERSGHRVRIAA